VSAPKTVEAGRTSVNCRLDVCIAALFDTPMLRFAYTVNILILLPVCLAMATARDGGIAGVFQGRVAESEGLRLIVFGMWTAILLGSVAGLAWPERMLPLLGLQVIYKTIWLLLFALPLWRVGGWAALPQGVTASFLFIVLVWPFVLWRNW
jgi:hypothetical protein